MSNYQPNYQQVPPPPLYATQTSTLAIVSLIAGIAGWVGVLGIGPLIAVICGHMAKNEINKAAGRITGGGLATAGLILGYLNLALSLIALCLFIVLPLLGFGGLAICAPLFGQTN
jgi:hypothetical protein